VTAVATSSCACAQTTVMAVPTVRMVLVPVTVMRAYFLPATTTCACAPATTVVQPQAQPTLAPVPAPEAAPVNVPPPPQPQSRLFEANPAVGQQVAVEGQAVEAIGVMGVARPLTFLEKLRAFREAKRTIRSEMVVEQAAVVQTTEIAAVRARRGCRL
jgi:hypothetical protein